MITCSFPLLQVVPANLINGIGGYTGRVLIKVKSGQYVYKRLHYRLNGVFAVITAIFLE